MLRIQRLVLDQNYVSYSKSHSIIPFLIQLINKSVLIVRVLSASSIAIVTCSCRADTTVSSPAREESCARRRCYYEHVLNIVSLIFRN